MHGIHDAQLQLASPCRCPVDTIRILQEGHLVIQRVKTGMEAGPFIAVTDIRIYLFVRDAAPFYHILQAAHDVSRVLYASSFSVFRIPVQDTEVKGAKHAEHGCPLQL